MQYNRSGGRGQIFDEFLTWVKKSLQVWFSAMGVGFSDFRPAKNFWQHSGRKVIFKKHLGILNWRWLDESPKIQRNSRFNLFYSFKF